MVFAIARSAAAFYHWVCMYTFLLLVSLICGKKNKCSTDCMESGSWGHTITDSGVGISSCIINFYELSWLKS